MPESNIGSRSERGNKCYGCGHVTTPFHMKRDCPHRDKPGWGSSEGLSKPLVLVAFSEENVAVINAEIMGVPVKIGLDSMSSISLLSHSVVRKLRDVILEDGPQVLLATAGNNSSLVVDKFATVSVKGLKTEEIRLKFGITSIPIDAIIGWEDIRSQGLLNTLVLAGSVSIPSIGEIAPEEEEEEEVDEVVSNSSEKKFPNG